MDREARRRYRRAALAALAAGAVLAVSGGAAGPAPAEKNAQAAGAVVVSMGDNFFNPVKAKVPVGGKVRWKNAGAVAHNATIGSFTTGDIAPGQAAGRKFKRAGKFRYVCTLHAGMKGTIKVVAPG